MARGSNSRDGRSARSERTLRSDIEGLPRAEKPTAGLKAIRGAAEEVPIIGGDGRVSPSAIKEGILTIRESLSEGKGLSFKDVMADIESKAGAAGKLTAAGVITDSVELAYLQNAREERERETPIDDIISGKRSSARVIEQYEKDIADAESRINDGLKTLAGLSPAGAKFAKSLPNEIAKALNSIGEGVAGEKKIARYDTKGVRVMLNDIFEELTK
jgi:hypothetical protein